eukprot:scaffold2920_cov307-Prasinococcus_capsulatus_cf.AAC.2
MLAWSAAQVTNPKNRFYETLSYLPPLSHADIVRQVQYILENGWAPCIEFDTLNVRRPRPWRAEAPFRLRLRPTR